MKSAYQQQQQQRRRRKNTSAMATSPSIVTVVAVLATSLLLSLSSFSGVVCGQPIIRSEFSRAQQPSPAGYEPCPEGEESVEFLFVGDATSESDNGWKLECTEGLNQVARQQGVLSGQNSGPPQSETIWNDPIGSLSFTSDTTTTSETDIPGTIRRRTCIPTSWTCTFTLYDLSGDGLTKPPEGSTSSDGWYALRYGAKTISTYEQQQEFTALKFCVGAGCGNDNGNVPPVDEDCKVTRFDITLDSQPQDTTYKVQCGPGGPKTNDAVVIWEGSEFGSEDAGRTIEHTTCLNAIFCCTLIVSDSSGDGLTSAIESDSGLRFGHVSLEYDDELVVSYEGEDDAEGFDILAKAFGNTCMAEDLTLLDPELDGIDIFATSGDLPTQGSSITQGGKIALIVCMTLLGIILIVLAFLCWRRNRDEKDDNSGARSFSPLSKAVEEASSDVTDGDGSNVVEV